MSSIFTEEELSLIQHKNKCGDWDDSYEYITIPYSLYRKLPKWTVPPYFTTLDNLHKDLYKNIFLGNLRIV